MEIIRHEFEKTVLWYLLSKNKKINMLLIPKEIEAKVKKAWETPNGDFDARARYIHQWGLGSLVKLQLSHHSRPVSSASMKGGGSLGSLFFKEQTVENGEGFKKIITRLESEEGYAVVHTITAHDGYNAFMCDTCFENNSDKTFTLEMLSSFSMDNLSPFQEDDAPNKYAFHRFKGGWSMEGKHIVDDLEDMGLVKAYTGNFPPSEKFYSTGSYPVQRFFPVASFEDKEYNVFWTAQIAHNASWQMELTRSADTLSFSGGLADCETGMWWKDVKSGEKFFAPTAYISSVCGDIHTACQTTVALCNIACDKYGEEGLPVCYNEFCTSWGTPTQEKMIDYAKALKDKGIKYVVIDAGWSVGCFGGQGGNGEWFINKEIFPDMRAMCDEIRSMGMIPGIWFEFEVTTTESKVYEEREYDHLHLQRNGVVINAGGWRTFWDFTKSEVIDYLTEKVIKLLSDNHFGYIKVDYNSNLGIGCDGAESLGEGLRQHTAAVAEFFAKIKREIPDIVIENCASGGHRLEPVMMGLSAVSSFSDAHEAVEIPYIAANLHNLMLPRQSLVWAVLHADDSDERLAYSMAAAFLGRICLSGEVDKLSENQWELVQKALTFYEKSGNIIKYGVSKIYGNRGNNMRYPTGTQVVAREYGEEMLIVVHSFENPCELLEIPVSPNAEIVDEFFNNGNIRIVDGRIIISGMKDFCACSVRIKL